jgi:hypothetical protein
MSAPTAVAVSGETLEDLAAVEDCLDDVYFAMQQTERLVAGSEPAFADLRALTGELLDVARRMSLEVERLQDGLQ